MVILVHQALDNNASNPPKIGSQRYQSSEASDMMNWINHLDGHVKIRQSFTPQKTRQLSEPNGCNRPISESNPDSQLLQ